MNRNELISRHKSDFFVIRTPMRPLSDLIKLNEYLQSNGNITEKIKQIFTDVQLREAIYLASPILYKELEKILNNYATNPKEIERVCLSLYQYYIRLSSRCTPFGLFAGYSVGIVKDQVNIKLNSTEIGNKHLRLDMDFLCNLSRQLTHSLPKNEFQYITNNSLYKVGNNLRFIESTLNNGVTRYEIVSVDCNPLLDELVIYTKTRRSFSEIINFMVDMGASEVVAHSYLLELINSQILLNNIAANATGDEYWEDLLKNLSPLSSAKGIRKLLVECQTIIDEIKESKKDNFAKYQQIKNLLSASQIEINESKLFQVDLLKSTIECSIDSNTINDVKKGCFLLASLQANTKESNYLVQFKKAFEERFETASVKLVEALDAEFGINYHESNPASPSLPDKVIFDLKLKKFKESLISNSLEVVINDQEAVELKNDIAFPDSFSAMVRLYKTNDDKRYLTEIKGIFGPSAANLLGRFCQSSEDLKEKVTQILKNEENLQPDKIFAEITHIPQSRSGNVICRPHLRKYEIAFMAKTTLNQEFVIDINDLYLKMYRGKLILFSKRLKKEIIPRLSTAHNFSNLSNLQLYHFLCDLQFQYGPPNSFWNWEILNDQEFLPRVRYKNVILSLATWQVKKERLDFFKEKDEKKWLQGFCILRKLLKLPDYIYYSEGDNDLLLDLNNKFSLQLLKKEWAKNKKLLFRECLFTDYGSVVTDQQGNGYTNEIIIPFTRQAYTQQINSSLIKKKITHRENKQRNFPIGSEWVYFNIYTGVSTADKILLNVINPTAQRLLKDNIISKWFFIRYANPKFHLRVRYLLNDKNNYGKIVQILTNKLKPLIRSGQINDLSLNTYKREVERYGPKTINLCESFFYINTKCVIELVTYFSQKQLNQQQQLMVAMYGCNRIMIDFGLSETECHALCKINQASFSKEFNVDGRSMVKDQIKTDYRNHKNNIETILFGLKDSTLSNTFNINWVDIKNIFDGQSLLLVDIISNIIHLLKIDSNVPTFDLISSLIHMFVNRLFQTKNRYNEFLIYDYMNNFYMSNSIIRHVRK